MSTQVQALVVGAGISGLATAYALQKAGVSTVVVEAASRPGGVIRSEEKEGYLIECGPQSFSGNDSIAAICKDLEILNLRVLADPKAPRYVLINGKLQNVPMGPGLLASPLLAGGTRGAILKDIMGESRAPEPDESVAGFTRRKFSSTLLDRLVGPFVSGIYAGDPERISLRAAFPILYEAETASGSVIRGAFRVAKQRKIKHGNVPREKATLRTFQKGNETLAQALASKLAERLFCDVELTSITALEPEREPQAPRFLVTMNTPRGQEKLETERLVLAVPAQVAGNLLAGLDPGFRTQLCGIEYAGVGVVSLGYKKKYVANSLTGFGFLVPRSAGLNVLGTVWNSSLFPGRAPDGEALLTSFVGGATNPSVLRRTPEELVNLVHSEIAPLLGISHEPVFHSVTVWPRAIAQYNLGHTARIAEIEKLRQRFPGLHFAGSYLNGPAIGTCVEQALKVADEIRISFAN